METLGSRIRDARKRLGITQTVIGDAFDISRNAVSLWENDAAKPEPDKLPTLAEMLQTTADWLLSGKGPAPATSVAPVKPRLHITPGSELIGSRDFPIYAGARGGKGHLIIGSEVVEYVKRPSVLEGVPGSYGLLVFGDSMAKAYRHGDMALVHPRLPPARDEVHVFYDHPPFGEDGETEAMLKNLLNWTDRRWQLEQFNPLKEFEVERHDWPTAHRVVGKYAGRR